MGEPSHIDLKDRLAIVRGALEELAALKAIVGIEGDAPAAHGGNGGPKHGARRNSVHHGPPGLATDDNTHHRRSSGAPRSPVRLMPYIDRL